MMMVNEANQIKKIVSNKYSGKMLYLTISGSHLYGFESEDSDVDFRGCFLADTNKLLGIKIPEDYIKEEFDNNDVVLFELKKEIELLNKGNCNVMEHLYAKQMFTSDEYFQLKKIISLNMNLAGVYHSYRGMSWDNYNDFCLKEMHTIKKFLYVFRGILAGMYAIEYRDIQPNLEVLLQGKESHYYYEPISELIQLKKDGKEKDFLPDSLLPRYHKLVEDLFTVMDKVYEQCRLSERTQLELDRTRERDLDRFLRKTRLNFIKKNNGVDYV